MCCREVALRGCVSKECINRVRGRRGSVLIWYVVERRGCIERMYQKGVSTGYVVGVGGGGGWCTYPHLRVPPYRTICTFLASLCARSDGRLTRAGA